MSIKALALELYRARQNVDRIKNEIEAGTGETEQRLKDELKTAEKEWQMLRKMLDGQKESGPFRKKFGQLTNFK